ncbi:hypothetical protein V6N12_012887 [Hibiscus sabdariffa]|uniref:Uncharacterized protein n=1 Tax=Hibiscus sabdariffa TaxID=183260 RepID=A0ABR2EH78_9ROSI
MVGATPTQNNSTAIEDLDVEVVNRKRRTHTSKKDIVPSSGGTGTSKGVQGSRFRSLAALESVEGIVASDRDVIKQPLNLAEGLTSLSLVQDISSRKEVVDIDLQGIQQRADIDVMKENNKEIALSGTAEDGRESMEEVGEGNGIKVASKEVVIHVDSYLNKESHTAVRVMEPKLRAALKERNGRVLLASITTCGSKGAGKNVIAVKGLSWPNAIAKKKTSHRVNHPLKGWSPRSRLSLTRRKPM